MAGGAASASNTNRSLAPLALSLLALVLCYWQILSGLVRDCVEIDQARHGLPLVAFVALALWPRLERIAATALPSVSSKSGLLLVAWGAAQAIASSLGVELFLGRTAFLIALAGVVVFHLGWRTAWDLSPLWVLLCLAVPLPAIIYNQITSILQTAASQLTETVLSVANVPLRWEGASMHFAGGAEQVRLADAYGCLRLVAALVAAALAYGYARNRKGWVRGLLAAVTLLFAVVLTSMRIVAVAWLDEFGSTAVALRLLEYGKTWIVAALAVGLTVGSESAWMWAARRRLDNQQPLAAPAVEEMSS